MEKILVWSDLVTKTGFERVSSSIFNKLTDELDIVGLGVNYFGDPHQYKFPVFPASRGGDIYGLGRISEFVKDGIDKIFILNDVWVIDKFLEQIKKSWEGKKLPEIIVYFPVDAKEHDPEWYKNFDIVAKPVTYTHWAKEIVLKAEPGLADRLEIIPHGVDTDIFYPLNKSISRAKLFGGKISDEEFIVLNANRNQPRKKLDITLEAFKLFSDNKPDTKLYMHCGVIDMHMDIPKLAKRFGIDRKLIVSSLNRGPQQVPETTLNLIYNVSNVGINTGLGEGWGLTSVEHASTRAPQIVPNHSACRELFSDCGILADVDFNWTFDSTMTVGGVVSPISVAKGLETLYNNKELYDTLAQKSFDKFTSEEYKWSTIARKWLNLIRK